MLRWLAGLYYGRESVHAIVQYHFFDGYPGSFVTPGGQTLYGFDEWNNFDQLKDSRAAFLNATFAVTPTVSIRAGLRYTKDKIEVTNFYALEGGLEAPSAGYGPRPGTTLWTQTNSYATRGSYTPYSRLHRPPCRVHAPPVYNHN